MLVNREGIKNTAEECGRLVFKNTSSNFFRKKYIIIELIRFPLYFLKFLVFILIFKNKFYVFCDFMYFDSVRSKYISKRLILVPDPL